MITEELKQAVRREAELLKIHATEEERGRLDFGRMHPSSHRHCIYGQMTGDCFCGRAIELLKMCAVPFSGHSMIFAKPRHRFKNVGARSFSAIEFYICQLGANNKSLISFLKGETETLEL